MSSHTPAPSGAPTPTPGPASEPPLKLPWWGNVGVGVIGSGIITSVCWIGGALIGVKLGLLNAVVFAGLGFSVAAFCFSLLIGWRAKLGGAIIVILCMGAALVLTGVYVSQIAGAVQEKQDAEDLAVVDSITQSQVLDKKEDAARERLLGGDNAEVTIKDATKAFREDDAQVLAKEIVAGTSERGLKIQEAVKSRNLAEAEVAAKGWKGAVDAFTAKRQREYSHLDSRIDRASWIGKVVYLVPVGVAVLAAILMTLYAAGQFGLGWGIKEPPPEAAFMTKVKYWFNRTVLAPSTKFGVGAFALAWLPFWWADAVLPPYLEPTPTVERAAERSEHTPAATTKVAQSKDTPATTKPARRPKYCSDPIASANIEICRK